MPVPNLLLPQGYSIGDAVRGSEVTKGIGLQNRLAEQELQMAPEKREMQRKAMQWQEQLMQWQKEDRPLQKEMGGIKLLQDLSPFMNWQNYDQHRQNLISQMGIRPEMLPERNVFIQQALNNGMKPEEYFANWQEKAFTSMDQRYKELTAKAVLANALGGKKYEPKTREEELADFEEKAKIKSKYKETSEKETDFEKSYQAWAKKPENTGRAREDFKRVWEKPTEEKMSTLGLAAKAVGVDPDKAAKGDITPEEANKILERYAKDNGIASLLKLLGVGQPGASK